MRDKVNALKLKWVPKMVTVITTYSVAVSTGSPLVYFTDVLKTKKCTTSTMNKDS